MFCKINVILSLIWFVAADIWLKDRVVQYLLWQIYRCNCWIYFMSLPFTMLSVMCYLQMKYLAMNHVCLFYHIELLDISIFCYLVCVRLPLFYVLSEVCFKKLHQQAYWLNILTIKYYNKSLAGPHKLEIQFVFVVIYWFAVFRPNISGTIHQFAWLVLFFIMFVLRPLSTAVSRLLMFFISHLLYSCSGPRVY